MKNIFYFVLVVIAGCFSACQRGDQQSDGRPTVALVLKTLNNPFFIDMHKAAEETAKKLDVNLVVQAAEREVDVEKQMQIMENLIQRQVDVICVSPSGSREIVPAIVKANKANIPVIVVDTRVDAGALQQAGAEIATFIGSDNVEGGRIAGEYIIEKLAGRGKVAVLEGIPGHETGDARLTGFYQGVKNAPGIEVVVSQTANWERNQGYTVFQNILQSHPEIEALFACNDMMALGAIEAIAASGKTGRIVVVGFDAVDDARESIQKGEMEGSIAQYPAEMGRLAVELALDVINGKVLPGFNATKIELITKENISTNQLIPSEMK